MKTPWPRIVFVAAALGCAGTLFAQTALYSLPGPLELNNVTSNVNTAYGVRFTVNYAGGIDVLSLGSFDYSVVGSSSLNGDGFVAGQSINLWSDTGTLLAFATINSGSATNDFVYSAITPVHLAAGTYVLSVFSATPGAYRDGRLVGQTYIFDGGISYLNQVHSFENGDIFPTNDPGTPGDLWIGANMTFSVTAVPEPATAAALAGVLALGLVAWRRRFLQVRTRPSSALS